MDSVSINTDNDMLKDKNRSYNTLNTLYHETRQEIDLLNKQVYVKDSIIDNLKTRLGRFERICMTVGQTSVAIGPTKSLMESLCKEICRLKDKKNDLEFKASLQAQEILRLNMQLAEKEMKLENIRCQPGHEKDQENHRLRLALEDRERSEATRAVLCTSLAEEADQLRSQLNATVKVCQELLARLEKEKKGGGEVEEMAQQQKAKELTDCSDRSSVNAQICQLQEENQELKQRVAYVQGLNSQWQKYDSSREDYIRGLCQRLKEMPGLGSVSTGLLHQEISRLNGLLEDKMTECVRLRREVEEIRIHDQERIQTLEQQVLIYKEDFKSERADRERAQSQIQDLKDQVDGLKKQVHKQQGANRENREVVPVWHIGHRISAEHHQLRTNTETQQQPAAAAAAAAAPNPCWNAHLDPSDLQCPQCLSKFDDLDVAEYLKHYEECVKL